VHVTKRVSYPNHHSAHYVLGGHFLLYYSDISKIRLSLQTLKFKAVMLVRSFDLSVARQPKELVISSGPEFADVDLANDDVLFNVVTSESALKRRADNTFWRGPKEKSVSLLQLLFSGLCPRDGIIVDLTAGTGMANFSLHAPLKLAFAFAND